MLDVFLRREFLPAKVVCPLCLWMTNDSLGFVTVDIFRVGCTMGEITVRWGNWLKSNTSGFSGRVFFITREIWVCISSKPRSGAGRERLETAPQKGQGKEKREKEKFSKTVQEDKF
jgi:hypothetical protein